MRSKTKGLSNKRQKVLKRTAFLAELGIATVVEFNVEFAVADGVLAFFIFNFNTDGVLFSLSESSEPSIVQPWSSAKKNKCQAQVDFRQRLGKHNAHSYKSDLLFASSESSLFSTWVEFIVRLDLGVPIDDDWLDNWVVFKVCSLNSRRLLSKLVILNASLKYLCNQRSNIGFGHHPCPTRPHTKALPIIGAGTLGTCGRISEPIWMLFQRWQQYIRLVQIHYPDFFLFLRSATNKSGVFWNFSVWKENELNIDEQKIKKQNHHLFWFFYLHSIFVQLVSKKEKENVEVVCRLNWAPRVYFLSLFSPNDDSNRKSSSDRQIMRSNTLIPILMLIALNCLHAKCPVVTNGCENCLLVDYTDNEETNVTSTCKRCRCLTYQEARNTNQMAGHCPEFSTCPNDCQLSFYDGCYACICP